MNEETISSAFTKQKSGQSDEKRKRNLKRKRQEEEESEPQKQQKPTEKPNASGEGEEGQQRDHFRSLPNELVSKILLDNFGRKELANSISLTCKLFHRIAHPRMHVLGEYTLPDLRIEKTYWNGDPPNSVVRVLPLPIGPFPRPLPIGPVPRPLPIGPVPRNIVKTGIISLRGYHEQMAQFFHSLRPLLQNGFTLRAYSERLYSLESLGSLGLTTTRVEFPHFCPHDFTKVHDFFLRFQTISFEFCSGAFPPNLVEWLLSPLEDEKPRILHIGAIKDVDGLNTGKFVEHLKKNFLQANCPSVNFAVNIWEGPANVAEFALEKADTGECLVLHKSPSEFFFGALRHIKLFRGRIGQTFDELISADEDIWAKGQIIEFL